MARAWTPAEEGFEEYYGMTDLEYWQEVFLNEKFVRPDERVHVYPVNDLRQHATDSGWCWCKPTYEEEGRLVVHHAMDGREFYEKEAAEAPLGSGH